MNHLSLLLIVLFGFTTMGAEEDTPPVPTEPVFIKAAWYETLKSQIAPPPVLESVAQKADEKELLTLQQTRTSEECERAKRDVSVSLSNFFGVPRGPLSPLQSKRLSPLFERIRNEGDYFIQRLKVDFPRQRPFQYIKELSPCVPHEVTGAYPSGHAALSRLYALVLTDMFPTKKEFFVLRAEQIADGRVLVGMHHRTDVEAGKKLGDLLYSELKKSEEFKKASKKPQ